MYEEEDKLEEHDGGRALSLCQHRLSTAFVGTKAEVTSDPWKGGMATNGVDSLTVPQALRRLSSRSTCHTASIRYEEHDGGRALSLCQHRLSTAFVGTKAEVTSDPWKGGMATNGVDSLTVPQALRRLSSRSTCHTASIRYM